MLSAPVVQNAIHNLPVFRLLGGPTRDTIDCYASMLGHSLEPDRVTERAQWAVEQGFKAQK